MLKAIGMRGGAHHRSALAANKKAPVKGAS
jgi:hypothetical protein